MIKQSELNNARVRRDVSLSKQFHSLIVYQGKKGSSKTDGRKKINSK